VYGIRKLEEEVLWVREAWGVVDGEFECTKQNEFMYAQNIV
jgi:hypothetical protein